MPYTKEQQHERYLRNRAEILKKAKESRVKHPRERKYTKEVYPLLLSIATYGKAKGLVNKKIRKFVLSQKAIAKFVSEKNNIKISQPTLGKYIGDLIKAGVIEQKGTHNYVNENVDDWWAKDTLLYIADKSAIKHFCKEHHYRISKALFNEYLRSLKEINSNETDDSDEFNEYLDKPGDKEIWIEKNKNLFPEYEGLLASINSYLPSHCQLRFLWDGCGRLVNPIATTPNPERDYHTKEEREIRPQMLKKHFGIDEYVEYDVAASIYRLTYNLNHAVPFYDNRDIYELFWKLMDLGSTLHKNGVESNEVDFHDSDERKYLKKIVMPIYMDEASIKYSVKYVFGAVIERYGLTSYSKAVERLEEDKTIRVYLVDKNGEKIRDKSGNIKYHKVGTSEREKFIAWSFFLNYYFGWDEYTGKLTKNIIRFLEKLKTAMKIAMFESTEHHFYGRDIFILESCLHIKMFGEFLLNEGLFENVNGRKILQIIDAYDGFYGTKAFTKEMFDKAYHKSTYQLKVELQSKNIEHLYINTNNIVEGFPIKRIRDGSSSKTNDGQEGNVDRLVTKLREKMDEEISKMV